MSGNIEHLVVVSDQQHAQGSGGGQPPMNLEARVNKLEQDVSAIRASVARIDERTQSMQKHCVEKSDLPDFNQFATKADLPDFNQFATKAEFARIEERLDHMPTSASMIRWIICAVVLPLAAMILPILGKTMGWW